jgi:hypothetical protein
MPIGATDPFGAGPDHRAVRRTLRIGHVFDDQRFAQFFDYGSFHFASSIRLPQAIAERTF